MLRNAVLGFGLLLMAGGALTLLAGAPPGLAAFMFGALLTLGTVFERWRYKPTKAAGAARGSATGERFIDPDSGDLVEVYYDEFSGERSYVKVSSGKSPV